MNFRKIKLNHILHPRVKCLNTAVSDTSGCIYLREDGYEQTLSSVYDKYVPESHKVSKTSFDDIIRRYPNFIEIDLLSIDVEGHEIDILKNFDIKYYKPKVISVEFIDYQMKKLEFKNQEIELIY